MLVFYFVFISLA